MAHMGRTCGGPNEIELTAAHVLLNVSRSHRCKRSSPQRTERQLARRTMLCMPGWGCLLGSVRRPPFAVRFAARAEGPHGAWVLVLLVLRPPWGRGCGEALDIC